MDTRHHLKSFANEQRANEPSDLFDGRVIWSEHDIRFRFNDFSNYLKDQNVILHSSELRGMLEGIGGRRLGNTHIAGKQVRPWSITLGAIRDSTNRMWIPEVSINYRKQIAHRRGHPEWTILPVSRDHAQYVMKGEYFVGKELKCGHVSAQKLDGTCLACAAVRMRTDHRMRTSLLKRFDKVADLIIEKGRLHYLNESEQIVELMTPVKLPADVVRDGCRRAAEKTIMGGRWYAKPSGRRMKIVPALTLRQRLLK